MVCWDLFYFVALRGLPVICFLCDLFCFVVNYYVVLMFVFLAFVIALCAWACIYFVCALFLCCVDCDFRLDLHLLVAFGDFSLYLFLLLLACFGFILFLFCCLCFLIVYVLVDCACMLRLGGCVWGWLVFWLMFVFIVLYGWSCLVLLLCYLWFCFSLGVWLDLLVLRGN